MLKILKRNQIDDRHDCDDCDEDSEPGTFHILEILVWNNLTSITKLRISVYAKALHDHLDKTQ